MKLKIVLGVVVSLAAISSPAQTNFTIVTRTNILQAAPNFREVNGQLYNIDRSLLWQYQRGNIIAQDTSGVLLQRVIITPQYERYFVPATGNASIGAYSAGGSGWQQRQVGETRSLGTQIFI